MQPRDLTMPEMLAKAQGHWRAGEAALAGIWCQKILARWPGQGDAHHVLGLVAHTQGDAGAALKHLRVAAGAKLAPGLYAANFAEICRLQGLLAEGEAAGRQAVSRSPGLAAGWNNLGIILQEAGKFEESRDSLTQALRLEPGSAEFHNNMGNTLKRLGDAGAIGHWQQALALRPDYPQPHSNLCCLLGEQGEYAQARAHGKRAIELAPDLADAYINLAGLESAQQNHDAAIIWLETLLAFAPAHAAALAALALVLKKLDRVDAALAAARQAVKVAPRNAEAYNALGMVLQAQGEIEAALECFERAASLPGVAAEPALTNRAVLFMEHGRKPEAEAAFDHALAVFPRAAGLWFNRADLQKFRPGDPAITKMEALLADKTITRNDCMLVHFALGKAYLDIGDSVAAFHHLDAGNAQKRATFSYDPAATDHALARIAQVFSPELLAQPAAGPASRMPVFVLGMPRSGTTLVEQILASHSTIHGAGELAHLQRMTASLGTFPDCIGAMTNPQLHQLGDTYLKHIAPLASGRPHVIDKMPANFAYCGLIRMILPGARMIHCRRNAMDTCLSCYSKLFSGEQLFAYNQTELGLFHNSYSRLMAHWRHLLAPAQFLEIDYEVLVADLEGQTRRMLDFLELEWEPACLSFHRTERQVRTASLNQVRQPVYASSAGRWHSHAAQLRVLFETLDQGTATALAASKPPSSSLIIE